jgi:hypothetical protein
MKKCVVFDDINCLEKGLTPMKASLKFLGSIIANENDFNSSLFTTKLKKAKPEIRSGEFELAISNILKISRPIVFTGTHKLDSVTGKKLITVLMLYFFNDDKNSFKQTVSIFSNYDEFRSLFLEIVQEKLLLTDAIKEFQDD